MSGPRAGSQTKQRSMVVRPIAAQVKDVLAELTRLGTKSTRDGMTRYGMPTDKAFGVPVNSIQRLARSIGPNHALALALWNTDWYEARMVAAYVGEPARLTPAQMDRWCREFDNWGICDTVCFVLFDRTPHAWSRIPKWARQKDEFVRRGGFVLLACLALHDKAADDESFTPLLPLIERGATDERNFVKKGVSWALRAVGRRSTALNTEALAVSRRLAGSSIPAAQWVGRDALRELTSPAVVRRLSAPRRRQQHGPRQSR
jgi:3-methyladenine DNA glycosylase AlkD